MLESSIGGAFAPGKKDVETYQGQAITMSASDRKRVADLLWAEHPPGTNPEGYSYNERQIGDRTTLTFNSPQIESDFTAIANKLQVPYTL